MHCWKKDEIHIIPEIDIFIDSDLNFTIRVFAWCLEKDHEIYKKFDKSVKKITLSNLIKEIAQYHICMGIEIGNKLPSTDKHVVTKIFNPGLHNVTTKKFETIYYRCPSCLLLCHVEFCTNCNKFQNLKISQRKK